MEDKIVIEKFIEYLQKRGEKNLIIDIIPDDDNRKTKDIDAIAGKYAIEHTSIDTIENQRRDSSYFMKVVDELEKESFPLLKYRLSITLPYDGVKKGQNWSAINAAIRKWVTEESPIIKDGTHYIENVDKVPFIFKVEKSSDMSPGVYFCRTDPGDKTLVDRVKKQLTRKIEKLIPYKDKGKETILIVDSNDIALMCERKMKEAIFTAFADGFPEKIDQIWFADTSLPNRLNFTNITDNVKENIKTEDGSSTYTP